MGGFPFSRLDVPFVPGIPPTSPFGWNGRTQHLHVRSMTPRPIMPASFRKVGFLLALSRRHRAYYSKT